MPLQGNNPVEVVAAQTANNFVITSYSYKKRRNGVEVLVVEYISFNEVSSDGLPVALSTGVERITGDDLDALQNSTPTEATRREDTKKALYDYMISKGIFPSGTIS